MKQIMFKDLENDIIHGGIMDDDTGDVICGCCGCVIPADEQTESNGFRLLKEFDYWVNLDQEIIGD